MADIFISYAREDRPQAERLAHALQSQGWSVWWDIVIPAGRTFDDVIDEAIDAAKCVIVMWSKASVHSHYVRGEAQDAAERGILVPLLIETDIRIPRAFRAIHAADLVSWDGTNTAPEFLRLKDDIARLLGPPPIVAQKEQRQQAEAEARRQAEQEERRPLVDRVTLVKSGLAQVAKRPRGPFGLPGKPVYWAGGVLAVGIAAVVVFVANGTETDQRFAEGVGGKFEESVSVGVPALALNAGDTFRDCSYCPEMIVIPAGRFTMGSPETEAGRDNDEGPQHGVTIARPFALGRYEVTRGEYAPFARESGVAWPSSGFPQTGRHPAVNVNWNDARRYVEWLSLKTGKAYRLPSEAEWEYAARAGTSSARYWGETPANTCEYASVDDVSHGCSDGQRFTAPAGTFRGNPFGLHDMLGNVWEWVDDCWNDSYDGAPQDGSAWTNGQCSSRVLRGGSWYVSSAFVRSASRFADGTSLWFSYDYNGFRVARTLP